MAKKKSDAETEMTALNTQVPTSLHRAVKVAAINAGMTLQQFVTDVLTEKVGLPKADEAKPPRPKSGK